MHGSYAGKNEVAAMRARLQRCVGVNYHTVHIRCQLFLDRVDLSLASSLPVNDRNGTDVERGLEVNALKYKIEQWSVVLHQLTADRRTVELFASE